MVSWHQSLYWRIAVGFIACLALLLLVQAMLFVWMMTRAGANVPNQPPERLAQTVALDVAQAVERTPDLDIPTYLADEYAGNAQPFLVLLDAGRVEEIGARFDEALKQEARARLNTMRSAAPTLPPRRGGARSPGPGRGPYGGAGDDAVGRRREGQLPPELRGPRAGRLAGRRIGRAVPIVADARLLGLVLVPPQPPFTFLLTRYAPTLLTVAAVTLVVGGAIAAVLVFGPTRRRLKGVESAARRLGSGDLTARAPDGGSDEVAAVASAFNGMAEELAARTEALVAADRARRQLLADVSHELNTPITAMRGYLETLSMPEMTLEPETRARYLAIVGDETARLERLVGELLELARLEGGGGSLTRAPIPVADLFARVRARHERAAAAAGVAIEADVEAGAGIVDGDRARLEQALQNLAANALRYAPRGSAVRLTARNDGSTIALLVSDEGPGIPAEQVGHVFERFYKIDQSRAGEAGSGSGLGLSIVKAIVERHGAQISVATAPGRTVFAITGLPRAEPPTPG
jgi:signal transduction histidine kinase